jgi:capsular exopolysaccharide synthesis family protein
MEKKDRGALVGYVDLFLRRKLLFLGIFVLLFALLGGAAATWFKSTYRARSLLAIGESQPLGFLQVPQTRPRGKTPSSTLSGKTFATIVEGLPMASRVAHRLGGDTLDIPVKEVHRAIKAEFYDPELLEITASARQPGVAIALANAAADEFVEYNRDQIRKELSESATFIQRELGNVSNELALINTEINEFKKREAVTNLEAEVQEKLDSVTEFEKSKLLAEADRAEQRARYEEVRDLLFDRTQVKLSPLEDPGVQALLKQAADLEAELERVSTEYGESHPKRALAEGRLRATRDQLEAAMQSTQAAAPIPDDRYYASLRTELTSSAIRLTGLDARIRSLTGAIETGRGQLASLPPKQFELRGLLLRESVTEAKYRRLLERLEDIEVEIEGIQGNATVLDMAVTATPEASRVMVLLFAAILSAIGAAGAVMTVEYRDNTIKSPEVIANVLRMTNFGTVPRIQGMGRKWLENASNDHAFEHYRKLRANVRFSSVKRPIRCMMVTSSGPGEGKSSTVASLGVALAQMDQRVLIVDADLRRPSVWRVFEVESVPGVTDVLTGQIDLEAAIKPSGFRNLDLLTSGPIPPNPAELFESEQMDNLVKRLREHSKYDMVLFDSAPTLLTTDTPVLAAKMDGVLVVLEAGKTTEEQGLMTKEMLVNSGARVLGAILNKSRSSSAGYYYYGAGQNGDPRGKGKGPRDGGLVGSLKNLGEKIRTEG